MKHGLILFSFIILSCSKDDMKSLTSTELQGKWIESVTRLDTVSFETVDSFDMMNLSRGIELKNGYFLPKSGSGPYKYKLLEGEISLYWVLSSDSKFKDYYFKMNGNKFNIGNFYGSTIGETLVFEKLE